MPRFAPHVHLGNTRFRMSCGFGGGLLLSLSVVFCRFRSVSCRPLSFSVSVLSFSVVFKSVSCRFQAVSCRFQLVSCSFQSVSCRFHKRTRELRLFWPNVLLFCLKMTEIVSQKGGPTGLGILGLSAAAQQAAAAAVPNNQVTDDT